jgi:hypothetical protein
MPEQFAICVGVKHGHFVRIHLQHPVGRLAVPLLQIPQRHETSTLVGADVVGSITIDRDLQTGLEALARDRAAGFGPTERALLAAFAARVTPLLDALARPQAAPKTVTREPTAQPGLVPEVPLDGKVYRGLEVKQAIDEFGAAHSRSYPASRIVGVSGNCAARWADHTTTGCIVPEAKKLFYDIELPFPSKNIEKYSLCECL